MRRVLALLLASCAETPTPIERSGVSERDRTAPPSADTTPPTGTLRVGTGSGYVSSLPLTVELQAHDDVRVTEVCLAEALRCSAWQPFKSSVSFTPARGAGTHTLRAWFRDAAGNVSSPDATNYVLDMRPPTPTSLSARAGTGSVSLSWPPFADPESGIASYQLVYGPGTAAPLCVNHRASRVELPGSATGTTISGLMGVPTAFRLCATDGAGNRSLGATATATPLRETDPPVVRHFSLNGGARWTNDRTVQVRATVEDASGITRMCLTEDPEVGPTTCPSWQAFESEFEWELGPRDGTKVVHAFFRDPHGNINPTPARAAITFDWLRPDNGEISLSPGSGQITASWSGFTDSESGVATYRLVMNVGDRAIIDRCSAYTEVWRGTATSATITGLTPGVFYSFRVCATDAAGNESTGDNDNLTLPTDLLPPDVERFLINGGAPTTVDRGVTLLIDPTDHSTITRMCLSNTPTCSAWQDWDPTPAYRLPEGLGAKSIYVWLRDANGLSMSTPAVAAIELVTEDTSCDWTEFSFGGHDYLICDTPTDALDAADQCAEEGMNLVSINSASEQSALVAELDMPASGATVDWTDWTYWIGLQDVATEATFEWTDGSDTTHTAFAPGQPDNHAGGQDCAVLGEDRAWWDESCADAYGFVCETGTLQTFCRDADGDGHGDPDLTLQSTATSLSGYATTCDDCNDADASYNLPPSGSCGGPDDPPTDDPPDPIPDPTVCAATPPVTITGGTTYVLSTGRTTDTRTIRATVAGWYHLYDAYVAESGSSQWNESAYLRVTNARNPSGLPASGNCNGDFVVVDNDNSGTRPSMVFMGTFWLEAGNNTLTFAHYCPRQRAGHCPEHHNPTPSWSTCSSGQGNSAHLDLRAFCAINPNG